MFQLQDQVVYGIHGVCSIVDKELRTVDRKKVEYYVLEPREQPGARFYIPTQNQAAVSKLRRLLSREELEALLQSDEVHCDCWIADENHRKQRYRELINSGDRAGILAMICTLHKHKDVQLASGRKFHLCDENFLRAAEKLLSSEFPVVLGMERADTISYIKQMLEK